MNQLILRAAASTLLNRHGRARPLVVGLLVLGLIASLAKRWGTELLGDGKIVWVDLCH